LIAISDVMVFASESDVSSTAIAWSMAAAVPVVATAVYSTAELVANKQNGLLVKPDAPKRIAVKMAALLGDRQTLRRMAEAARGQAYEVFSLRRCVDQHARLYQNLLTGAPATENITDAAFES
jgi:starch synthase